MLVENLLTIPLALAMAESGGQASRRAAVLQALRNLARMPLMWAILLGFAFALLGLRLPDPLARTLGLLGAASTPVALFIIGGTLVGLKLDGGLGADLLRVSFGKLVLHPLAVLLAVLALPPFDPVLRTAVVLTAAMPMMSIYPVLAQRFGQERLGAAALLAATVLSFVTLNLGLVWLQHQPGWLPG
jgi:predicted permease